MNEAKIIDLIQCGRQEKAFARLYRFYPGVEKHICINSGSKDEALDIFQDALVILYRKVTESKPDNGTFSCEGYLVTTCKLLWSNELRKKKVRTGSETGLENLRFEDEIQGQLEKEYKLKTIENVLLKLGEKCRTILEQFYFRSLSMEHIARQFGFKTVESAKVQKYKCIETARKMALENKMLNESTFNEFAVDLKTERL
ncbi:MAG: sigma-70 family RNA polymerase sigma factor [Bacteroidetes bacterium]|nr:sigma-70 family RNA polymerase sigma factor [Bacteroidota bacterium]